MIPANETPTKTHKKNRAAFIFSVAVAAQAVAIDWLVSTRFAQLSQIELWVYMAFMTGFMLVSMMCLAQVHHLRTGAKLNALRFLAACLSLGYAVIMIKGNLGQFDFYRPWFYLDNMIAAGALTPTLCVAGWLCWCVMTVTDGPSIKRVGELEFEVGQERNPK